jgi:uncharacterized membrane protein YgcG
MIEVFNRFTYLMGFTTPACARQHGTGCRGACAAVGTRADAKAVGDTAYAYVTVVEDASFGMDHGFAVLSHDRYDLYSYCFFVLFFFFTCRVNIETFGAMGVSHGGGRGGFRGGRGGRGGYQGGRGGYRGGDGQARGDGQHRSSNN